MRVQSNQSISYVCTGMYATVLRAVLLSRAFIKNVCAACSRRYVLSKPAQRAYKTNNVPSRARYNRLDTVVNSFRERGVHSSFL